jgi:hypothetical protein
MFKAENNKYGLLKIPDLDRVSENFVSQSVLGDKVGKIAFPWENFVGTFGVCECKSETCLDWPPDVIRLLGCWHSDEMLRYLHVQAEPVMCDFARHSMLVGGSFTLIPNQTVPIP